jgi:hypothetical protein
MSFVRLHRWFQLKWLLLSARAQNVGGNPSKKFFASREQWTSRELDIMIYGR